MLPRSGIADSLCGSACDRRRLRPDLAVASDALPRFETMVLRK